MSLKQKALGGIAWTFAQQFGVQLINLVVQVILARILLPEVFGLIAMIQIFLAIGQTLMDAGMTSSLIRTEHPDDDDYSTVFWMNIGSSIIIYLIIFSMAPFIAQFFNQPVLKDLVRLYTLSFVIKALVGVQTTRLTKELNFRLQMFMQIPSTLLGGIVGVILAYKGYGVWSLAIMSLTTATLFMLQHWIRIKWKPKFAIKKDKLKYHFNFGYKLTLSGILTTIYTNSYSLIIGKIFSPAQLGFYTQANTLRMLPVDNLTMALRKVTYPIFSLIQNDDVHLKSAFSRITNMVFFVVTPVMFILVLIAEPLFRFVLTDKWLPSVPFFQFLSLIAIVYPISLYNLNIILAKGRSDLHLKMEILKKGISSLFLLLIFPFGLWGVVIASGISMLIHAFVNCYYCGKLINFPVKEQILDVLPILMLNLVIFCSIFLLAHFVGYLITSDLLFIIVNSFAYLLLYWLFAIIINFKSYRELTAILSSAKSSGIRNGK